MVNKYAEEMKGAWDVFNELLSVFNRGHGGCGIVVDSSSSCFSCH